MMMRNKIVLISLMGVSFTITAFANSSVELSLSSDHMLPGLAVGMFVRYSSDVDAAVPQCAMLNVKQGDQEFSASTAAGPYSRLDDFAPARVAARSVAEISLPVSVTMQSPDWFSDRRLSRPGTYRLQIVLRRLAGSGGCNADGDPRAVALEDVASNWVTLVVNRPTGDDAIVWQRIEEKAGKDGWGLRDWLTRGRDIAQDIWRQYPKSGYAPYLVALIPSKNMEDARNQLEKAIAMDPDGPEADVFRYNHANVVGALRDDGAATNGNVEQAKALNSEVRRELEGLARSPYFCVREHAKRDLQSLPSDETLLGIAFRER